MWFSHGERLLPFWYIIVAVFGLMVGSFLNVVVHRVPRHESVLFPGSHCPTCGHGLRPWENIPVVSWLILRGRCHQCHSAISWRYPALEWMGGCIAVVVFWRIGWTPKLIPALLFVWALLALAMIDLETCLLPDRITKPGIIIGLLLNGSAVFWQGLALTTPLNALLGVVIGYGCLWLLSTGYQQATGRYGMGGGDLKLLGMIGAWLGWQAVLMTLMIAAVSGGLVAMVYLLRGKGRDYAIPFGPYLALGGVLMLLWPQMVHLYLHLLS